MTPLAFIILLFASGVLMLLAEAVLPSHGILGVIGAVAVVAGVGVCFWVNQYAGVVAAVTLFVLAPFVAALWVKVWPHTYAGKRLILGPTSEVATGQAPAPGAAVQVGQVGVVVTELRPGGTCEFGSGSGATRVEARSEHGIIPAGRQVEVVALVDRRPLVRAVS